MNGELEIRGKFKNRGELENFIQKARTLAKFKVHRHRFAVLFTTSNKKGWDLQIRCLDEKPEIILKIGKHTGNFREEHRVSILPSFFLAAINLYYSLGFKRAVVAEAEDWIFELDGEFELKATSCDEKIFCWEIESTNPKLSVERLLEEANKLSLVPLKENEIANYWRWMKKYVNRKFKIGSIKEWYGKYLRKIGLGD